MEKVLSVRDGDPAYSAKLTTGRERRQPGVGS
jgi:hypothetical protein